MRLVDRLAGAERFGAFGNWEGGASGAAIITTTYGSPDKEAILPTFAGYCRDVYNASAVVFGAILARLMLFSEASFCFEDETNGSVSKLPPRAQILKNPWPNGTTGELLARMIQDVDLAGNAYIARVGGQLTRLRPDQTTIVSEKRVDPVSGNSYRTPIGYVWDPNVAPGLPPSSEAEYFDVRDVAHWSPLVDPTANFRGMSWITPVVREIEADQRMTDHKVKYLDNAASPNILLKYRQRLLSGTVEDVRERFEARYGGRGFGTVVLDQGADLTVIGNSFEQMQFSTVQAAGENRILIASGVPGIVCGSKEGLDSATYSNYAQAMRRFSDLTIHPLWRSVCGILAKLVQVPSGSRLWYDVTDIPAMRAGEKERADTALTNAQAIGELVKAGYTLDTCRDAVVTGDMSQLARPEPVVVPALPGAGTGSAVNGDGAPPPPQPSPAAGPVQVAAHTRLPPSSNGGA